MRIEVRSATGDRFDDVAILLGPKNPDSSVCWCLSHRLDSKTNRELVGRARGEFVRELCDREVAPGVLAYDGDQAVGWAAVAPRSELPFARSKKIPQVDDLPRPCSAQPPARTVAPTLTSTCSSSGRTAPTPTSQPGPSRSPS